MSVNLQCHHGQAAKAQLSEIAPALIANLLARYVALAGAGHKTVNSPLTMFRAGLADDLAVWPPNNRDTPSPVMRDAERRLAAVEDQRHDQILFVVEMADQSFEQTTARQRVGVALLAGIGFLGQRAQ
jgi:hypothetical protein